MCRNGYKIANDEPEYNNSVFIFVLFSCFFFYRLYVCMFVNCVFFKDIMPSEKVTHATLHAKQWRDGTAEKKREKKTEEISPCRQLNWPDLYTYECQHKQIRKSSGDTQSIYYFRLDYLTTQYKTSVANTDIQTQTTAIIICASFFYRQHIYTYIYTYNSKTELLFANFYDMFCFCCLDRSGISISLARMLKSFYVQVYQQKLSILCDIVHRAFNAYTHILSFIHSLSPLHQPEYNGERERETETNQSYPTKLMNRLLPALPKMVEHGKCIFVSTYRSSEIVRIVYE